MISEYFVTLKRMNAQEQQRKYTHCASRKKTHKRKKMLTDWSVCIMVRVV